MTARRTTRIAACPLVALASFLHGGAVLACSCRAPSVPDRYEASDVAFRGWVVSSDRTGEARLYVEKVWKGSPPRQVTVSTRLDSCGVAFVSQKKYLVFAKQQGAALVTDACMGTTEVGSDAGAQRMLEQHLERAGSSSGGPTAGPASTHASNPTPSWTSHATPRVTPTEIPDDVKLMLGAFGLVWLLMLLLWLGAIAVTIGLLVFKLVMIIDAVQRTFPGPNDKLMWVLLMLLLPLGEIFYYFLVVRAARRQPAGWAPASRRP